VNDKVISFVKRRFAVLMLILFTQIQGCSFQSKQFNALKAVLTQREPITAVSWMLEIEDAQIVVYAIQSDEGVIFSDGRTLFLKFDGWHILEVQGLSGTTNGRSVEDLDRVRLAYNIRNDSQGQNEELTNEEEMGPQLEGSSQRYNLDCAQWLRSELRAGHQFSQTCAFTKNERFLNVIDVDQSGDISKISTLVHPGGLRVNLSRSSVDI
jgi:hypothetical protein